MKEQKISYPLLGLVVSIVFLLSTTSIGQEMWLFEDTRYEQVIAQNLIIRSGPGVEYEIKGKIPFGEKLPFLKTAKNENYDTIQTIKTEVNEYVIAGYWRKVKYKGISGYINSAYLYHLPDKIKNADQYNQDYVILLAGGNCFNNTYDREEYRWYGYYRTELNCGLKEIEFTYGRQEDQMINLYTIVKNDKDLLFILGSRKKMEEGEINEYERNISNFSDHFKASQKNELIYTEPHFDIYKNCFARGNSQSVHFHFKAKSGDKIQELKNEDLNNFRGLFWMGDLDRDGEMDYIINFGNKEGRLVLYLSSEKEEGQLVKPVARYYTGYCC